MIPPDRVSEPVSFSGGPIATSSNGSPSGVAVDRHGARRAATTTPGTIRTSSTAIASAPALRSSLIRSSMPAAVDRAVRP